MSEIWQRATDFACQELGWGRALVVDVVRSASGATLQPVHAVGLDPAAAWQDDSVNDLIDQAFSAKALHRSESSWCLPVLDHRGRVALLLYADKPAAPPPPDLSARLLARASELSQAVGQVVPSEGQALGPGAQVAGRYVVDQQLLSCRFSTLYRAHDRATGSSLVLRHLEDPDKSREARLQTLREGRTLHRLRHRNLPRVLDVVEDQGHIYVVLEDVTGTTLQATVEKEGPLQAELIRRYLKQFLSVLGYLHGQTPPIVHRDLRPETILVSRHGVLKVAEFGLAKLGQESQGGTRTAFKAHGHPRYAAPEQLLGDTSHPRNDLYAVGAMLYFLATGTAPPEAMKRFSSNSPLPSLGPDFPADLAAAIDKLTTADSKARPQSVEEVLEWLEARPAQAAAPVEEVSVPESLAAAPAQSAAAAPRKPSMWQLLFGKKKAAAPSAPTRVPRVDLARMDFEREVGRLLPETVSRAIGGVAVRRIGASEITVAVKDPSDPQIYDAISCGTRGLYTPTVVAADPELIDRAQEFIYRSEFGSWLRFLQPA